MNIPEEDIIILGIESSCDDTAAAVVHNGKILANVIASQEVHKKWGGVVPELASRAHQVNIVPVVDAAIKKAGIDKNKISAIAFTSGPGLLGSLLVGTSFAKGFALAQNIPLIEVNHMQAHILAHFIRETLHHGVVSRTTLLQTEVDEPQPKFPFLCLTVSGGHTQIVLVKDHFDMKIVGETIDDAAGEAFDKTAKIMGLPYPGGPLVDKLAQTGDKTKFKFAHPQIKDLDYSFSGIKTSFLYFVNDQVKKNSSFIEENKNDLCASIQHTIVSFLIEKLKKAAKQYHITEIAIAGGVSANSELRRSIEELQKEGFNTYIPKFEYCTDNAAMIAITGYYKFLGKDFSDQKIGAKARYDL